MKLFGIPPKREEPEPGSAPNSARSNASGGSLTSNDSPSFGKMKLVIKNTFIGGFDEPLDDDPPRTLARSASDSKLDCQSSTSSVVFWYPQRGGGSMSQSNSSVASRSDAGQDDHDDQSFPEPYHQLFDRNKRGALEQAANERLMTYAGEVPVDIPGKPSPYQVPASRMQMPQAYQGLPGRAEESFRPPAGFDKASGLNFEDMVNQASLPPRPPGYFDRTGPMPGRTSLESGAGRTGGAGPVLRPPPSFETQTNLDVSVSNFGDDLLNREDPFKVGNHLDINQAELGDLPPAAQLAQLQLLQNELMRSSRLDTPMGMLSQTQEFGAAQASATAERLFNAPNGVAQQQLRQQLIESQMQQMQLQQQMQQLQLRQQQLQQQLTTQPPEEEAMLAQVPYNDEGERASLGSRLHPDSCNPCIFWFKDKALCNKGAMCDFCHFRHPGQKNKRIRPSKNTRLQMRAAQAAKEEP